MKKLLFFLLINGFSFFLSTAQDHAHKLISEIKASNTIQCEVLGYAGMPSELSMKADTLNTLLTQKERILLFEDSSYTLKYYSFCYMLSDNNDSIAFELLKQTINDTTEVDYFCSCLIKTCSFNELLLEEYYNFIQSKYRDGYPTVLRNGKVYMFPEPNKKTYKEKVSQLKLLIQQSAYAAELLPYLQ